MIIKNTIFLIFWIYVDKTDRKWDIMKSVQSQMGLEVAENNQLSASKLFNGSIWFWNAYSCIATCWEIFAFGILSISQYVFEN